MDDNRNGALDGSDLLLPGALVTLQAQSGQIVGAFTTLADGSFAFADAAPGMYWLVLTPPPNYVTSQPQVVAMVTAGNTTTINLASYRLYRQYLPMTGKGL